MFILNHAKLKVVIVNLSRRILCISAFNKCIVESKNAKNERKQITKLLRIIIIIPIY